MVNIHKYVEHQVPCDDIHFPYIIYASTSQMPTLTYFGWPCKYYIYTPEPWKKYQ